METDVWPSLIRGRGAAGVIRLLVEIDPRNVASAPASYGSLDGESGSQIGSAPSLYSLAVVFLVIGSASPGGLSVR